MQLSLKHLKSRGFTIIELLIVIVVIGILAALVIISYSGIQAKAIDKSVQSDTDSLEGLETRYATTNGNGGKAWYSGASGTNSVADPSLGFTPTKGNIIDVVVSTTDYCIRIYNPGSANYKKLATAYTKGSSNNACNALPPSLAAQADSDISEGVATSWRQVSTYGATACGVANNNKAYCWGLNNNGQLGNNSTANSNIPVAVDTSGLLSGKTIQSVTVGNVHACALTSDGQAYCWGNNSSGQLGNNSTTSSSVPVAVTTTGVLSGKTIKAINASTWKTCAIASDDQAYCWGSNGYGVLGNNSTTSSSVPVAVTTTGVLSGKTIKAITGGWWHTCAIASDNKAYCWGNNAYGQLGNNTTTDSWVPVAVNTSGALSGKTIASIGGGNYDTCASAQGGNVYCWGSNSNGQLGNNTTTDSWVPVAVDTSGVLSGKTILSVSVGGSYTCVVASDNQAYCWGSNSSGELGATIYIASSSVPVAVTTSGALSGKTINSLSAGSSNCAIASDNQAYCWGSNSSGQLGNKTTTTAWAPVKVVFQ